MNKNPKKRQLLSFLLILLGLLTGGCIALFIIVSPNISEIIQDIKTTNIKNILMFFGGILIGLLWIIDFIVIVYKVQMYKKEKNDASNQIFTKNKYKQMYLPDYLDNNYYNEDHHEEIGFHNDANHFEIGYHDIDNHYQDNELQNQMQSTNLQQNYANNNQISSNDSSSNIVPIRVYLKPGQKLPKGYYFDEKECKIKKLPNYDEIIRNDIERQLSAKI